MPTQPVVDDGGSFIVLRPNAAYRRYKEKVGLVPIVKFEVEVELSRTEPNFAEPVLHDIARQQERKAQDDALVPPAR